MIECKLNKSFEKDICLVLTEKNFILISICAHIGYLYPLTSYLTYFLSIKYTYTYI